VAGEGEVLGENLPHSTLFTSNPTCPDLGLNPGHHRGKPVTNHLSYGTINKTYLVITINTVHPVIISNIEYRLKTITLGNGDNIG
jgi:hypothetical protein